MPTNKKIDKPKGKSTKGKYTHAGKKRIKKPEPTVKVFVPVVQPGKGVYDPEPPPSEYEISYKDAMMCVQMEKLAVKGCTNDQIIKELGISRDTFYRRLREDSYFSYCLGKHRGNAVMEVENSLFKAANGFEYTEQSVTPSGKVVTIQKAKTPDTAAIKFFLTNRAPNEWKNKVEQTHQVGEGMQAMAFMIKRRED